MNKLFYYLVMFMTLPLMAAFASCGDEPENPEDSPSSETTTDASILAPATSTSTKSPLVTVKVLSIETLYIRIRITPGKDVASYVLTRSWGGKKEYTETAECKFEEEMPESDVTFTIEAKKTDGKSEKYTYKLKTDKCPYTSYAIQYYTSTYKIFPLEKCATWCQHAIGSGDSNVKYLRFTGPDDSPLIQFTYCTPWYEGINSTWSNGTYQIKQNAGYWEYGVYARINGSRYDLDANGKLKISTKGGMSVYEYTGDGAIYLYFIGK